MKNIKTILICLIIIFATCAICIGLIMMNEQTTTLKLSETCSIDVTGDFDTVFENGMNQIKIFDKFNNKEYKSMIAYSNSANAGLQEITTFGMFKSMFVGNAWDTGAEPIKTEWNGDTVYVIYTGNNATHDNILIISKNRDDCIKMYKSIKYNTNKSTNKTVNTTVEKISNNNQEVQKNTSNNAEELRKIREESFNSGRSYQSYLDSRKTPTPVEGGGNSSR